MVLEEIPNSLGGETVTGLATTAQNFLGDPTILVLGVLLIVGAVLILFFLKQIIINSLLGVVAWAILMYGFQVQLPFWASLIVSIIFGLVGIGVMLVLRFLGLL